MGEKIRMIDVIHTADILQNTANDVLEKCIKIIHTTEPDTEAPEELVEDIMEGIKTATTRLTAVDTPIGDSLFHLLTSFAASVRRSERRVNR